MCTRLVELLDRHLQITDAEAAAALGYRDTSVLWKVRRGGAFVDVEKLAKLADLGRRDRRANLHWLISGDGPPLLGPSRDPTGQSSIDRTLSRLSREQIRALETVISALLPSQKPKAKATSRGAKAAIKARTTSG